MAYNPADHDKLLAQTEQIRIAQEQAFASLSKSEQDEQEREMKRLFDRFTEFSRREEALAASFYIKDDCDNTDAALIGTKPAESDKESTEESEESDESKEETDHDKILTFYKTLKSMIKDLNVPRITEASTSFMAKLKDELDPLADIFMRNIQACEPISISNNIVSALDHYKPGNILIVVKRTYVVFKNRTFYEKYMKSMLLNSRMARSNYLKNTKHYQILTLDDTQKASIVCSSADLDDIEAIKAYIVKYFKGKIKLSDVTLHQTEETHLVLDTITGPGHEMITEISALIQKLSKDDEKLGKQLSTMSISSDDKSRKYLKWLLSSKDHTEFGKPCVDFPLGIRPNDYPILIMVDNSTNNSADRSTVVNANQAAVTTGDASPQTVDQIVTKSQIKEWIEKNPPKRKDTPTAYREKLEKKLGTTISSTKLSKILKKKGYVSKKGHDNRYWELENSDSDPE